MSRVLLALAAALLAIAIAVRKSVNAADDVLTDDEHQQVQEGEDALIGQKITRVQNLQQDLQRSRADVNASGADVGQMPQRLSLQQRMEGRASLASFLPGMIAMKGKSYTDTFCSRSNEPDPEKPKYCETVDGYPGSNSHSELKFATIIKELMTVPAREQSGEIRRLGDLGYFIFNDVLWDKDWKVFPIGADIQDHRMARPVADILMGKDSKAWNKEMIRKSAEEFFKDRKTIEAADYSAWVTKLFHKILLNMDLNATQVANFESYKGSSMAVSMMPKSALAKALNWKTGASKTRDELLETYVKVMDADTRGLIPKAKDLVKASGSLNQPDGSSEGVRRTIADDTICRGQKQENTSPGLGWQQTNHTFGSLFSSAHGEWYKPVYNYNAGSVLDQCMGLCLSMGEWGCKYISMVYHLIDGTSAWEHRCYIHKDCTNKESKTGSTAYKVNSLVEEEARAKRFLADLLLTTMTSAGGLSLPTTIGLVLGVVYGGENSPWAKSERKKLAELNEKNVKLLVYETLRRFPVVVGFPMWSPDVQKRHVLNVAMGLRDPKVWEKPLEFKLRNNYHDEAGSGTKIGLAWAQQGKGPEEGVVTPDSRGCPGQTLSVVMIEQFLLMMKKQESKEKEWWVSKQVAGGVQITEGPCGVNAFTLSLGTPVGPEETEDTTPEKEPWEEVVEVVDCTKTNCSGY